MKHGVGSAITLLVAVLGLELAILIGGAVLVEVVVFDIPGNAKWPPLLGRR